MRIACSFFPFSVIELHFSVQFLPVSRHYFHSLFFLFPELIYCHLYSNPGHPFSCGVTLAKLAAVTMDELGNETFDTSGALDKLRKVSITPISLLIVDGVFTCNFGLSWTCTVHWLT